MRSGNRRFGFPDRRRRRPGFGVQSWDWRSGRVYTVLGRPVELEPGPGPGWDLHAAGRAGVLFGAFWFFFFFFLVAEGNAAPYFGLILLEHLCSPHWIAIERCSRRLPRPRPDPYLYPTFAPMWTPQPVRKDCSQPPSFILPNSLLVRSALGT